MINQSNAAQVAARMRARAEAVGPITRQQADRIKEQLLKVSLKHMNRLVYSKAVDLNRNGTPKWSRSEALRENEKAFVRRFGLDYSISLQNSVRYAKMRHEMGKPGAKRPKVKPYSRFAPWRDITIKEMRRWSNLRNQEALRRILGTGGIRSFGQRG